MKISRWAGLLALALALACPTSSQAAFVVPGDLVQLTYPSPQAGSPGGIFVATINPGPSSYSFETFCVQLNEFISLGTTYEVISVTDHTVSGNYPLTDYVAWLYDNFLDGSLNGFTHTGADANALQLAIWEQMGFTDSFIQSDLGAGWFNAASTTLASKTWLADFNAASMSGWTNPGNIKIMNLGEVNSGNANRQDQLVRIDAPGNAPPEAPEAASLAIWGVLASVAAVRFGKHLRRPTA
jgi:hypothetical protein